MSLIFIYLFVYLFLSSNLFMARNVTNLL
uniref:Uncharacterized protein n=1 Tax=Heterorhabditis bacteriophora TaxID=37862 RepID=A0A1I7WQL3_HETBA